MQRVESINEMRAVADELRRRGKRVAFVPTMGALHAGHLSLMKLAREKASRVVVSIFVNPLQFGPNEDFAHYPRNLEGDLAACQGVGVDAVFTPATEEMFPRGYSTHVSEDMISRPLEGISRPGYFRGVLTVTVKLLNIVRPDVLVLGEKDVQLVAVLRKALADLQAPVAIATGPTVRDPDGLACSARNRDLTPVQRADAVVIHHALRCAREMVDGGVRSADRLMAEATHLMSAKRRVRVIYISVVDRDTMEAVREVAPGRCLMVAAAWVDEVRLTDNMPL